MLENPKDSVAVAEKLLELVKSICNPNVDPRTIWSTKTKIQNACDVLLANVLGPLEYTTLVAESCHESSALRFVTNLGIAELIGNDETTLAILSAKSGVDPQYLGVTMSCLLGRGYFEEVGRFGSHIYKNNTLSDILRNDSASGLKSAIIGDEAFRATSCLLDAAKTITPGNAEKNITAANIALDFSGSIFEWMSRPEQAWRGKRLGKAMQQFDNIFNPNISKEYPWHGLLSPIVDIGGGIGALEMSILADERNSHLKFVLFDIPDTIENAKMLWSSQPPKLSSQISFAGGDFMASSLIASNIPQGKPTYIIRHALHNWTDSEAVRILSIVRQAMPKNGRLLLVEILLRPDSPRFVRTLSVLLLAYTNGLTRTQEEMEALASLAGFRVDKVSHTNAGDSVLEVVIV